MNNNEYPFRFFLFLWIILANLILQLFHIPFGWAVFISNIMLFTLPGNIHQNFITVELSAASGLILAYIAVIVMSMLSPFGSVISVMSVLCVILFCIIMFSPKLPRIFNNVTFAYFTCAFIAPESFFSDFVTCLAVFTCGSIIVNFISIKLFSYFFERTIT